MGAEMMTGECLWCSSFVAEGEQGDVRGILLIHVAEAHPAIFVEVIHKVPEKAIKQYEQELISR